MKVLVLSPHTDDAELGLGGSIHKHVTKGDTVETIVFTDWNLPETKDQCIDAQFILGCHNVTVYDFVMGKFYEHRGKILQRLYEINQTQKPDFVYVPSGTDAHQDHQTIHQEAMRVFKHCSILGYNLPWNNITSTTHQCFNEISQENLEAKIKAIQCYTTESHRTYMSPEYHKSLAIIEGQKIGVQYAESFEVIRWKM